MEEKRLDVLAFGNALVDISAKVSEKSYSRINAVVPMERGTFSPVSDETADKLISLMRKKVETGGGSTANTMFGLASFGGRAGFAGCVGNDRFGNLYQSDLLAHGIQPHLSRDDSSPTGRCVILVTPDSERTMNTCMGASEKLGPSDVDESVISASKAILLEGYMLNAPSVREVFHLTAKLAYNNDVKVALSMSAEFCIRNHRDDMAALAHIEHGIVFANKNESMAFAQTKTFEEAVPIIASLFETAALTRGSKGAVIVHKGQITEIPVAPIDKLVDTTGAGDQFAAGFLYGYTQGMPMEKCGRLGAMAAASVIQHIGPRPQTSYASFIKKLG